jgi:cell division protein FtsX
MLVVLAVSGLVAFSIGAGTAFILLRYLHKAFVIGLLALLLAASAHQLVESLKGDGLKSAGAQVTLYVVLLPAFMGSLIVALLRLHRTNFRGR